MLSYYKRYKARVAPVYRSEIDRHLFATASFRRRARNGRGLKSLLDRLRFRRACRKAAREEDAT